jgi:protein-S-isoprenylcysteine O-methyltransferase Ste14
MKHELEITMTTPVTGTNSLNIHSRGITRWVVKTIFSLIVYAAVLFLSAGRLDWPAAWLYLGLIATSQILSAAVLIPTRPDLLVERSQMQAGTKTWDKYLSVGMALVGPLVIFIVAGLDARFGWSGQLPLVVRFIGLAAAAAGVLITLWSMTANPFFASTVRIQQERGHTVTQSGPYRWLRHPGYTGALLFDLATPLALASTWAFVPAAATVIIIIVRTALEDSTLQAELSGYPAYARSVRYRLLPGVW